MRQNGSSLESRIWPWQRRLVRARKKLDGTKTPNLACCLLDNSRRGQTSTCALILFTAVMLEVARLGGARFSARFFPRGARVSHHLRKGDYCSLARLLNARGTLDHLDIPLLTARCPPPCAHYFCPAVRSFVRQTPKPKPKPEVIGKRTHLPTSRYVRYVSTSSKPTVVPTGRGTSIGNKASHSPA